MNEVYRAMKILDFEWKVVNPYHVHVRRKNPLVAKYVRMSLQLYQVDYKSYLLDFKSLLEDEKSSETGGEGKEDTEKQLVTASPVVNGNSIPGHHTMEFFEMCAALITQLAR